MKPGSPHSLGRLHVILISVFLVVPIALTAILYTRFPESVYMHMDARGNFSNMQPRYLLFFIPAIGIIIELFLLYLYRNPRFVNLGYNKKYNPADDERKRKLIIKMAYFIALIFLAVSIIFISKNI